MDLLPGALEDHHDAGLVERGGAQFEEKVHRFPPVYARNLEHSAPNIFGEDGIGNTQRRLSEGIFGINLCTLGDKEFNDIIQPLIGCVVQRGPAELRGILRFESPSSVL